MNDPFDALPPLSADDETEADDAQSQGDSGYDGGEEPPPCDMEPELLRQGANKPLNDFGNGQRLCLYFGDDLMWVPRVGWFTWTGAVWLKDSDEIAARQKAQSIGALVEREIGMVVLSDKEMERLREKRTLQAERIAHAAIGDEDSAAKVDEIDRKLGEIAMLEKRIGSLKKEHRSFARTSGNTARIKALLEEGGIGLAKTLDDLDRDPLMVNTLSGVLVFRVQDFGGVRRADVELVEHSRAQRLTKMMPVAYVPGATAPRFMQFLDRIQPDLEMQGFLQRIFGLSMTGLIEQMLVFLYGDGANGKSVLVDLVARILGDYAATAKIESLTGQNRRGGGDATPDLVPLIGARFVRSSEPDKGVQWQEGLIKELTGGEPILVRALNQDFVEVRPKFKLVISGNHKPEIRGTDDGIWRRLKLVPFDVQIPEHERIPKQEFDEMLFAEAPGVLNWMVQGLLAYLEAGLREPATVRDATRAFREESDPYGAFLEEVCVVTGTPDHTVKALELVNAFHFWLGRRGEGQFKDRTVALALKDRSRRWRSRQTGQKFSELKSGGTMRYTGIRFTDLFARDFDNAPKDQRGRPLLTAEGGAVRIGDDEMGQ